MTNGTERLSEFFRRRGKSLPKAYSYQLGEDAGRFGLDVFGGGELRVDESRMAVFVPYADGNARDGVGDLLEIGGIDHTRHQRNPIVLYDHGKEVTLPVGTAEDPDSGEYTIEQDEHNRTEGGWCHYYQGKGMPGDERGSHALFCEQLFDLQCRKLVRGGSLGYTIIEASKLPADHRTGTPEGLHLIRTKMLEFSVVVLPCNEDTVGKGWTPEKHFAGMRDAARRILCLPHVCGKRMSPHLVKSLAPWAPPRKAQMGYEGKSCPCQGTGECECKGEKSNPLPGAEEKTRMAATANTTGYAPGDKVAARELLRAGNFGAERYTFANPGERLDVVAVDPGGRILVRNKDRKTEYFSSAQLRKTKDMGGKSLAELRKQYGKAQPSDDVSPEKARQILKDGEANGHPLTDKQRAMFGAAAGKSLHALRKKYRPVGGVRRRLKKSTPGASMIHVRHKDVDAMREEAEARGVKTHLAGEVPGGMKFKLMGDDESIDAVATLFGSRLS